MKIDRNALTKALSDHDQETHYLLDRKLGRVLSVSLRDKAGLADVQKKLTQDKGRYLQIPKPNSRANFEEMEKFIAQLQDPHLKQVCQRALTSHKPFREFRDALATKPKEKRAWESFQQRNLEQKVNAFLRSVGLS